MGRLQELIEQHCPDGVEYKALGECAELIKGSGLQKKDFTEDGIGCIHYGQIHSRFGTYAKQVIARVPESLAKKLTVVHPGDLIVAVTSEDVSGCCKAVAWVGDEDIVTGGHCVVIRHDMDAKYLSYCFQTDEFYKQKKRLAVGAKVTEMRTDRLAKIKIPVPPIEVQREIVRLLDAYTAAHDALVQRLNEEIELQATQLTIYRETLLTFSERERVRWATLGEIATNLDSMRKPVTKSSRTPGPYPYYGASGVVDHVAEYIFDGEYLLIAEDGANLLARSTPIAFVAKGRTWVNNHAHILKFDDKHMQRFVEIYLNHIDISGYVTGAAQPKLNQANLNRIPIPMLPVEEVEKRNEGYTQAEEQFEALINTLANELALREAQLNEFRNQLLTFPEKAA